MFSWKSFVMVGILWFSTANADMAENIANMDIITSAKLCATAQGIKSYYSYNPIKLDPESVQVEKVKLSPLKIDVLKGYSKSSQILNKASDQLDTCIFKNLKEIEAVGLGIEMGWSDGVQSSKFGKGRRFTKARGIGKSDEHLVSDDVYDQIKKINAKTENKATGVSNYVYLSEKEIETLKKHSRKCAVRNTPNEKNCDEEAKAIAKKLFPNFIFTRYMRSAQDNYQITKLTTVRSKLCGQEAGDFDKAEKDFNDRERRALGALQSFGLDIEWLDESKISGLDALLMGEAEILAFTYKPSSEKLKKLNSDLDSNDETVAHHARILKKSVNNPKILFYNPIRYKHGNLQGYLGSDISSIGSGGMYDQCEEDDIKVGYKSWMKTLGSSVGSAVK